MKRNNILILICSAVLLVLFQNFSVPQRVLPVHKKFESSETNPARRIRDYVKYEIGDETISKIERLKSKVRFQWGSREPANVPEEQSSELMKEDSKPDPLKYTFANFRTLRVRDEDSEIKCRVDSKGVSLSFEQQISSTSSYIIQHDTEQQKSQAKFQLSW